MGACDFGTSIIGKFETVNEAYQAAKRQATEEYGTDPYNGTISTTDQLAVCAMAPQFGTVAFRIYELKKLQTMEKRACLAVEITGPELLKLRERNGLLRHRGIKAYYFFGLAAT